jgi:cytochrome c biogenesis protein CcdA
MRQRTGFDYDHQPWHLVSIEPGIVADSRRWNRVVISILILIVMGLLTLAFTPQPTPKVQIQFAARPSPTRSQN